MIPTKKRQKYFVTDVPKAVLEMNLMGWQSPRPILKALNLMTAQSETPVFSINPAAGEAGKSSAW